MDKLREKIRENRPKIADSSLKTYTSIISNLYKRVAKNDDVGKAYDFFTKNVKEVLSHLKDTDSSKRKTVLASLVVLTEPNEKAADLYRKQMLDDKNKYDDDQKDQKMTDSQRENWVTQEEVTKLYDQLDKENRPFLTRDKLRPSEFQTVQNWLILALYHLQAPRRLKDYTEMKLRNIDEEKDNYVKANTLVFNQYKTAKTHGKEVIPMNAKLKFILNKWKTLNPHEYMLVGATGKKLTSSQLQQRLNQILGKKASVNILRHSFLSEKYKDLPAVRELEQRAEEMGHTVEQALLYVKKDAPSTTEKPVKKPRLQKSGKRVKKVEPESE
jgi:integrase